MDKTNFAPLVQLSVSYCIIARSPCESTDFLLSFWCPGTLTYMTMIWLLTGFQLEARVHRRSRSSAVDSRWLLAYDLGVQLSCYSDVDQVCGSWKTQVWPILA